MGKVGLRRSSIGKGGQRREGGLDGSNHLWVPVELCL